MLSNIKHKPSTWLSALMQTLSRRLLRLDFLGGRLLLGGRRREAMVRVKERREINRRKRKEKRRENWKRIGHRIGEMIRYLE
jgi:hypothetical protein